MRLDPLGDDVHVEPGGQLEDHPDERAVEAILLEAVDERLADLQPVDGQRAAMIPTRDRDRLRQLLDTAMGDQLGLGVLLTAVAEPTDPTNDWPYTVQMNLSVQQQLTPALVFSVAYVGSVSRNQIYAPDLNFVFVGPVMANVRALAARPNVRMVGAVPHAEVARYMAHFDVGVLPYVLNRYTAAIMPAKLKEYLAAGLPIVATPLPEIRRFADEHPEVVTFANDAPDFVAALRAAAAKNGPAAEMRRMRIARRYDWSAQMALMNELMERALDDVGRASARRGAG